MIPLREQELLRRYFEAELQGPVHLEHFTAWERGVHVPGREPCPTCKPARRMMEELAALSPLVRLRLYDFHREPQAAGRWGVDRVPATLLHRGPAPSSGPALRLYGLPGGRLFPAFIDLLALFAEDGGAAATGAPAKRRSRGERATGRLGGLSLRLFVTGACPYCPEMLLNLGRLALASPQLRVEVVEATEFPRLAQLHNVRLVPLLAVATAPSRDDQVTILGAVPLEALWEELVKLAQSSLLAPGPLPSGPASPLEPAPAGGRLLLPQLSL